MSLTEVEQDFIEFIAKIKGKTPQEILQKYLALKKKTDFGSNAFKEFTLQSYDLFSLVYTDENNEDLVKSYKFFELLHLYRFLSYEATSEQKPRSYSQKFKTLLRLLVTLDFAPIRNYFMRHAVDPHAHHVGQHDFPAITDLIIRSTDRPIKRIVDYGCGLAYISFYLAKKVYEQKGYMPEVHVVDVDTLVMDFVKFRFDKNKIPLSVTMVSEDSVFPRLPEHDVCIATEVLEHVTEPETVIQNITNALQPGGVLYGDYDDHASHAFHISPDLSRVRAFLQERGYIQIDPLLFKKSRG